ncbi:hypothetical protein HJD18_10650 [Thermoleophilia bacterium SCSIO 60948]|nr:hypothetical protein HJD18_10650 [Thermoleophilia bacterium SCSIO 60948]
MKARLRSVAQLLATRLGLVLVVLIGVPAGYAVAHEVTQTDTHDSVPEGSVAAEDCPAEIREEWSNAGMPRDTFPKPCPQLDETKQRVEQVNLAWRSGLTRMVENMEENGVASDDPAYMRATEQLERLGGPYIDPSDRNDEDDAAEVQE